jgi:hypothetical protein
MPIRRTVSSAATPTRTSMVSPSVTPLTSARVPPADGVDATAAVVEVVVEVVVAGPAEGSVPAQPTSTAAATSTPSRPLTSTSYHRAVTGGHQ